MKTHIAWTLALAAGAWAISPASAQQAKTRGPAPQAPAAAAKTQPPAARTKPREGVVVPPPAAKLDPAAEKASQEAAIKLKQEMEQILAAWEKKSSQVKTLNVKFRRIDDSAAWGKEKFTGQATLQSPDLACLHFNKEVPAEGAKPAAYVNDERIVCNGQEVLQYKWDTQQVFIYPLDKQAQQKTLQQGPLPFLFNMKADVTTSRYDMALVKQTDKQYTIRVTPLADIDRESFSLAFLQLNKTTYLPDYLRLVSTNGKDYQDFIFDEVVANQPLDQKLFQKFKMAGWKEVLNPAGDGRAAAAGDRPAPRPGRAPQPAPGQAQRPGVAPR